MRLRSGLSTSISSSKITKGHLTGLAKGHLTGLAKGSHKKHIVNPFDGRNRNKTRVNKLFSGEVVKLKKLNLSLDSVCMVFDGQDRRTSKMLQTNGIQKDKLLLIERDEQVAKSHMDNGYPCYEGTFEDFVDKDSVYRSNPSFMGGFFDFMGQVHTNGPSVIQFLNTHKLDNNLVLAFTFAKRVTKGPRTKGLFTFDMEYTKFHFDLLKLLKKKGYNLDNYLTDEYKGTGYKNRDIGKRYQSMFFSMYSATKNC